MESQYKYSCCFLFSYVVIKPLFSTLFVTKRVILVILPILLFTKIGPIHLNDSEHE